ncbi:endonuclease I [Formosa sp. Hel1_33_131]|jgi:hypothetical protein|uniref:hypothetical protein n=1 Tax=Formosa sp. Hel1_33_131 TaxID=1336794 RepID=UPI0008650B4D|nr:hypothetical protein [Formosa sp. Hel1_33_131]AOR27797.1 endonuclease I [Formosa sp. Hel1_33_131]
MKKFRILSALFVFGSFMACEQNDAIIDNVYDNSGQTGVGFTASSASVAVRPEGATATLVVQATTTSATARSYDVVVDATSTGAIGDYTVGTVTIPADSYDGTLAVSFVDTNLAEGVAYTLVLDLDLPAGVAVVGSKTATINYNKYLICNDFVLTMNEDSYADERSWEVTDTAGVVVESGDGYSYISGGQLIVETMTLADGCYTFTIFDAYSDGQYDGVTTGNYSLDCSIINVANGEGNWGGSEATDFCVNP